MLKGNMEPLEILRGRLAYIVRIDKTLTIPGASADAEATGNAIKAVDEKAVKSQASADKAQKTADDARKVADGAVTDAQKAQKTADEAKTAAAKAGSESHAELTQHIADKQNPHSVTGPQLGIGRRIFLVTVGTEWAGEAAPFTQTIPVSGLRGDDVPIVDLKDPDNYADLEAAEEAFAQFDGFFTQDGALLVRSKEKTATAVKVRLRCDYLDTLEDPKETDVTLIQGQSGPISIETGGGRYTMSNAELGPVPSAPGKYSFELV